MGWLHSTPAASDDAPARGSRLPSAVVAAMVARAKRGDGEAFAQLYDHYLDGVYAFVAVRLRDREAAQDMTQTIFVRALQSLASCHDDAAFPGWLYAIVRNSITDHQRAARFRPEALDETFDCEDPDPTPEDATVQRDDVRVLQEARQHCLSSRERELFDLVLAEMNHKQIAEALGSSHGAVRVAHHRLIRKLQECLQRLAEFGRVRDVSN